VFAVETMKLVEEVEKLSKGSRMVWLTNFWERFYSLEEPTKVPATVSGNVWNTPFNLGGLSRILDTNLLEIFKDPEKYAKFMLEATLYKYREFREDVALPSFDVTFGTALESSMYGLKPIFAADTDPWTGTQSQGVQPPIQKEEDLDSLEYPDFYHSGLMPQVHHFYKKIKELTGNRLEVSFPPFSRGLWGIASDLVGIKDIVVATYRKPDFVRRIMDFAVESKIRLLREREKFLDVKDKRLTFGEDEVNCDFISPRIYKEFIFPYDQKLASSFDAGVFYYHSCGNLTPILEEIVELNGLRLLHVGPWTDFGKAVEIVKGRRIILEKRMHCERDILYCTPEQMKAKLSEIVNAGQNTTMEIKATSLDRVPPKTIKAWLRVSKEVLGNRALSINM
jgi:uroporphyrinogen-III decarboxylase